MGVFIFSCGFWLFTGIICKGTDDRFARGVKEEGWKQVGNGRMLVRFPPDKKAAPMSIKAYKYRISANKTTTDNLDRVLNLCRELYNAGLQERRDAYETRVILNRLLCDKIKRKNTWKERD